MFKKIISVAALVVFLLSLAVAAFASGGGGSAPRCNAVYTINNQLYISDGKVIARSTFTGTSGYAEVTVSLKKKTSNGKWTTVRKPATGVKTKTVTAEAESKTTYRAYVNCVVYKDKEKTEVLKTFPETYKDVTNK